MRRTRRKLALVVLAIVTSGFASSLPASAACNAVAVWTREPGQTKQYVVNKTCVTPDTGFPQNTYLELGPTGEPSTFEATVEVWLTVP